MTALLGPANRAREANKWWLVAHTVAMFSVATMSLAITLFFVPVAYINAREFSGTDDLVSGPVGYMFLPKFVMVASISNSAVPMNQWLVDGLLASPMLNSATEVLNRS